MKYGLTEKQVQEIIAIISSYQEVDKAIIFGSRAINTFKEASDVDIALIGEKCDLLLSAKIKDHLEEETYLPFFFDIIAYNTIQSPELKKHIQTKGKVIFQRKEEWKEVKLGEIINLYYGKSLVANKRIIGDIPVYSSAGITGYHNEPLVNSRGIIVGRKGTIGTVYKSESPFYCIDTVYYILANDEKFNFNFMYYLLQTLGLNDLNSDSAVPGLNRNTVYDQSFMLPPLPEQKAIAEVLSSLDDKIDLLHRQNKTLEEMAETLFRQWFIEERDESWEEGKLGNEFDVLMGQSPQGTSFNKSGIGIPMYQGNADFGFRFPKRRVFTVEPKRIAEQFDTLVSVRAPVGALNMSEERCCIGRGVARLRYKDNPKYYTYCYYKLRSLLHEIGKFNDEGTVFGSINKKDLSELKVTIPSINIIDKFQNEVNQLDLKIIINTKEINTLINLRKGLLPKLMSGEVRIYRETNQKRKGL